MKILPLVIAVGACAALLTPTAHAVTSLGTGDLALIGRDLTDQDDIHVEDVLFTGFDATFTSNEEPGFDGAEFAFNIFDNLTGGGINKWCCGSLTAGVPNLPFWVDADFGVGKGVLLTSFTLTSSNDTPNRDPRAFRIQGSNDGVTYTDIFVRTDTTTNPFALRNEVLLFDSADFTANTTPYQIIRYQTDATGTTAGAFHALAEVEYFGTIVPEPSAFALVGLAGLGLILHRRR
jgi:hypothetical protein